VLGAIVQQYANGRDGMSEKKAELEESIISKIFDLEETFEKVSHEFRDLARLLMRYKKAGEKT